MKRILIALALGTGLLATATLGVAGPVADQRALFSNVEILPDRSLITFAADARDRGQTENPGTLHRAVALPPGASFAQAVVVDGPAGANARVVRMLGEMRGIPVALIAVERPEGATGDVTVELRHDGNWGEDRADVARLRSPGFDALFGGTVPRGDSTGGGSYLILTTNEYLDAVQPLADWKRRKGFEVVVATTDVTGFGRAEILAWLRNAYATWDNPPEYLLLVGDVGDIPTWDFSSNPTDHPYTLMDDEDWLPDLILGRLSVETDYEAQTVVGKTVSYERNPGDGSNPDWFRRYLGVAGNYASTTPINTVKFCGQQLQSLGFENSYTLGPYDGIYSPPNFGEEQSVPKIRDAIDSGVGFVVYRGWAYGVKGWEPPHFTTAHIPTLANGPMTPIVMSFVCLNGDFSVNSGGDTVCFGEIWTRAGTPETPNGAVAFIGNGEHWSHTRYNDAMAIAYYERIVDRSITRLGELAVAGRLRFMDYFPHQIDETGNEESVEFYFHIYNLLGDPELNFWRDVPADLVVAHSATLPAGANAIDVNVHETGGSAAEGARVGVVQNDQLLGCAWVDAGGLAHVALGQPVAAAGEVAITVTYPDHRPYEGTASPDDGAAFLATSAIAIDDAAGNGDGLASPGETVDITVTVANGGALPATGVSAQLFAEGGATVDEGDALLPDVPAGGGATATDPFTVTLDGELEDGQRLRFTLQTSHAAGGGASDLFLPVVAPAPVVTATAFGAPGHAAPGQAVELVLTLSNAGGLDASGLSAVLELPDAGLGTVVDANGSWGALAAGASADNAADSFTLQVADDVPHGHALPLLLHLSDASGFATTLPLAMTAGLNNPAAPIGPDDYGYYAYDSADILYDERPPYAWTELSPLFGGTGTELVFNFDNQATAPVSLPFDFVYYGQTYDAIRIADNGWISFDLTEPGYQQPLDFYNWGLPNQHGNGALVAPFYDNLTTTVADSLSGSEFVDGVYHAYDAGAGTYTVEWSRMRHYRPEITDLQTFQVKLFDPAVHVTPSGDGEIQFLYRQVNNGDWSRGYATVGMEDDTETTGLQLSYSGVDAAGMAPLGPGLAVRITTAPPTYAPFALASFAASPADAGGLELSWSTADERPVVAWRVERLDAAGAVLLAELPAARTHCTDTAADPAVDQVYRLTALHPYGQTSDLGSFHTLLQDETVLKLSLGQSLPNPMRESARIDYVLPRAGALSLKIYDTAGRLVRSLAEGPAPAGAGSLLWDGRDAGGRRAPTGVYFYRLEAEGQALTRKLMVIR